MKNDRITGEKSRILTVNTGGGYTQRVATFFLWCKCITENWRFVEN